MKPGEQFRATVGFDRLDAAARKNAAAGAHLWTVIPTYGLTDEEAAHAAEGVDVMLDRAHLLSLSPVCCYRCEMPYDEALKHEKCKGNPVRYSDRGEPCYADGTTASGGRWRR